MNNQPSLPPQDIESERQVISAILDDENSLIEALTTLAEEDFFHPIHRAAFQISKSLFTRSIKPSYLEVLKEGVKDGNLSAKENRDYLNQIIGCHVSTTSLPYWIKNIKDQAKLRKLKRLATNVLGEIESVSDVDKLVAEFERKVMDLRTADCEKGDTGKDLADLGRKLFQENKGKKGQLLGIPTGIGKLNRLTGGWKDGDLVLLAGETGKGKTAWAQNFIAHGCFIHSAATLYINSEMSKKQVITRFASIISNVHNERIKYGEQTPKEDQALESAMCMVEVAPFYHYFMPSLDINKAVAVIRKESIQHNIKFVVVDYVGRMEKQADDLKEWQILENIVKTLKTVAQELQIAVMVLAQLNDDQRLQGAKRMENEADVFVKIGPMTSDELQAITGKYRITPNYKATVKKNRDGESGVAIPVLFRKETLEIVDVANA